MREKGIGGKSARNLARRCPAHSIADDVGPCLRCSRAGVLIAMAYTAAMGQHGVNKMVRRHSWVYSSPNKTIHGEAAESKGTLVLGCGEAE